MTDLLLNPDLKKAIRIRDLDRVKSFLKDVSVIGNLLVTCAEYGTLDIMKCLIDAGANINEHDHECLIKAGRYNHFDVIKYLIDIGVKQYNDYYVFRHCVMRGQLDIAEYLLDHGAKINAKDNQALKYCINHSNMKTVKFLIEKGADSNVVHEIMSEQSIIKVFFNGIPFDGSYVHTDELCSESFEGPKENDLYIILEDDSITIFKKINLTYIDPELIKNIFRQC